MKTLSVAAYECEGLVTYIQSQVWIPLDSISGKWTQKVARSSKDASLDILILFIECLPWYVKN